MRLPHALSRFLIVGGLLLGSASAPLAQTADAAGRLSAPSSRTSSARAPRGGAAEPCPAPTGTRISPLRDAQGRCPQAAKTDPAIASFSGNQIESTGYSGNLGAALQQLDPALPGR